MHYNGVVMSAMTFQITSLTVVDSTVYSRRRSKKTSKLRVTGHGNRWISPYKGPITRKMFPFDDVIVGYSVDITTQGGQSSECMDMCLVTAVLSYPLLIVIILGYVFSWVLNQISKTASNGQIRDMLTYSSFYTDMQWHHGPFSTSKYFYGAHC